MWRPPWGYQHRHITKSLLTMEARKITNNIYNTVKEKSVYRAHSTRSTKRYELHRKQEVSTHIRNMYLWYTYYATLLRCPCNTCDNITRLHVYSSSTGSFLWKWASVSLQHWTRLNTHTCNIKHQCTLTDNEHSTGSTLPNNWPTKTT